MRGVNELENKSINGNGSQLDITGAASVSERHSVVSNIHKVQLLFGSRSSDDNSTAYNYSTIAYGEIDSLGKLFRKNSDYLGFQWILHFKLREIARSEGYDNILI
ncbi:MAG: hypothetical protein IPG99_16510 [Ignavibacteria bacterium]|nr:hypothetical protein [Ignavibacteria bacterium]